MDKIKILFLCLHNSARSQMAEAYMQKFRGDEFAAESAGIEIGILHPLAVEVMKEDGIDISKNRTKEVFDLFKQGKSYFYVITVWDSHHADRFPIFPGFHKKIVWDFDDPATFTGSWEEQLAKTRKVRDGIKTAVLDFIHEVNSESHMPA